jgi:hypothetical protein
VGVLGWSQITAGLHPPVDETKHQEIQLKYMDNQEKMNAEETIQSETNQLNEVKIKLAETTKQGVKAKKYIKKQTSLNLS